MSWTPEQDEELIRHCKNSLSASQIAQKMGGGMTRNSIIGRIHRIKNIRPELGSWTTGPRPRLGLYRPGRPRKDNAPGEPIKSRTRKITLPSPSQLSIREAPALTVVKNRSVKEPQGEGVPFLNLEKHMCKWPTGQLFCGEPTGNDPSYCPYHRKLGTGEPIRNRSIRPW